MNESCNQYCGEKKWWGGEWCKSKWNPYVENKSCGINKYGKKIIQNEMNRVKVCESC